MTNKIYTVTDLGPGDGGKGGVVHKISTMMRACAIVKVGGGQGSHGVSTSRGENFAFSHWGCGTLEGIKTHISTRMIVMPEAILNEADALRYGGYGIQNPFSLLTIDEKVLCATPYHGISSRLKEMAQFTNPRGTIGTGVGEAYRYLQMYPELAIRVSDLSQSDLKERLAAVREQIRRDLEPIITKGFLLTDHEAAEKEKAFLDDDGFLDYIVKRFKEVSKLAKIVDHSYLEREILSQDGVVVVESSHGVLNDHFFGFYPHVSAIRTLPSFTHAMLKESGYKGEIVNIGVFRAYAIRHGAGPLPTNDPKMVENLLPGSHKEENRYQGKVRMGPLDLVLLRYAIEVCGGPSAFDGLAVTWFDQITTNGEWRICDHYLYADHRYFFTPSGDIQISEETEPGHLIYQEALGEELARCEPEITTLKVPSLPGEDELYSFCAGLLGEKLAVPIRMISFGPTERDKICK
jgi:adenylosuccinate synthase